MGPPNRFPRELSPPNFLEPKLVIQRKYWFVLVPKILSAIVVGSILITASIFLFLYLYPNSTLLITSILVIIVLEISFSSKSIIEWFFHVYVVRPQKIQEISYSPLFEHNINEILLNQVRCTEIDVKTYGFINDILDFGNIIITFDRPTSQDKFIFHDIKHPHKIATKLVGMFDTPTNQNLPTLTEVWYQDQEDSEKYHLIEEIRPAFN